MAAEWSLSASMVGGHYTPGPKGQHTDDWSRRVHGYCSEALRALSARRKLTTGRCEGASRDEWDSVRRFEYGPQVQPTDV